ncbi:SLC13 family permease [Cellulomonas sp. P22]|uniref:SLC13 family permease n=1 Tax=Cellulomonas sp. P22 TaxID=3373189 RepID=UPI00379F57B4
MDDATISLVILAGSVALFIWNRLPVGVVAILTALSLTATGVLDVSTALGGFGEPVVIFIATLFVVSEGLDSSGVTGWAGQVLTEKAGAHRVLLLGAVMLLAAVLSALITPNGAVAALLPVVVAASRKAGEPPSRLLIPLAFAASAGALLTLSGSPVNVIASEAALDLGTQGFGYFEFAVVGVPLVLVTVAVALLTGRRLLPHRSSDALPPDFSAHVSTLVEHYSLDDGVHRLVVAPASGLVGQRWSTVALADHPGLSLVGVQRAGGQPGDEAALAPDDALVVAGPPEQVAGFASVHGLDVTISPFLRGAQVELLTHQTGVAEIVIPPRSRLVGEVVFPGMVREGGLLIQAVRHLGRDRGPRPTTLTEGDALLVHGPWTTVQGLAGDRDVLVVDCPDAVRRQVGPLGPPAMRAIGVLVGMVALLATGIVPPAVAGLIAATAMVVLRVVHAQQAYRAISWQTVVLIGGLIPLSTAIQVSGAADLIADLIVDVVGSSSPYLLMVVLFGLTAVLGQVISNTATVLIVVPVALAAAAETGISPLPVLMLVAVAGAASFLTPIATPANMMVMGPGGYRFGDYWRIGLVTMLAWLAVALLVIPTAWPFVPA